MHIVRRLVFCGFACLTSIGFAQNPALRFHFAGDTLVSGRLLGAGQEDAIAVESDWFSDPIVFQIGTLREARTETWRDRVDDRADAVLTKSEQRYVGRVDRLANGDVQVLTSCLGTVRVNAENIVDQISAEEITFRILPLHQSQWRWQFGEGWAFDRGQLIASLPYEASLGRLDLPKQFRLRLSVRCQGEADFDLSLGDRRADAKALDTWRGGSRPRLPQESLISRLEWVGQSVALVRSNGSVSDSEVFSNPSGSQTLDLELTVDQQRGSMMAWAGGQLVGRADLPDENPAIHSDLTLINRGAPITIERLDVLFWDGETESNKRPWILGGAGQGGEEVWLPGIVEVLLRDGCRVTGKLGTIDENNIRIQTSQGERRCRCEDVVRLLSSPSPESEQAMVGDDSLAVLMGDQLGLKGRLVPGDGVAEKAVSMSWKSLGAIDSAELRADSGAEVLWPGHDQIRSAEAIIELSGGGRVVGQCLGADRNAVQIQSTVCSVGKIHPSSVRRIKFGEHEPVDPELLAALLTVPRKMKADPPTHLVIAANGDAIRCRLISMDRQSINVEVRSQMRRIPRERVAELVWLGEQAKRSDDSVATVWSTGGDRLRLSELRMEGEAIVGQHTTLGQCRWPIQRLLKLQMKGVQWQIGDRWRMSPAKEPRDFAEEE